MKKLMVFETLDGVRVHRAKRQLYLNDQKWDGLWRAV